MSQILRNQLHKRYVTHILFVALWVTESRHGDIQNFKTSFLFPEVTIATEKTLSASTLPMDNIISPSGGILSNYYIDYFLSSFVNFSHLIVYVMALNLIA